MQSLPSKCPTRVLLMLAGCMRSPSAPVRLAQPPVRRNRPRSSLVTEHMLARHALIEVLDVYCLREACDESSAKVANQLFNVMPLLCATNSVLCQGEHSSTRWDGAVSLGVKSMGNSPTVPFIYALALVCVYTLYTLHITRDTPHASG